MGTRRQPWASALLRHPSSRLPTCLLTSPPKHLSACLLPSNKPTRAQPPLLLCHPSRLPCPERRTPKGGRPFPKRTGPRVWPRPSRRSGTRPTATGRTSWWSSGGTWTRPPWTRPLRNLGNFLTGCCVLALPLYLYGFLPDAEAQPQVSSTSSTDTYNPLLVPRWKVSNWLVLDEIERD